MKKIFYLLVLVGVLLNLRLAECSSSVINTPSGTIITGTSFLTSTFVSQNPIKASQGEYVNLLFKIENIGTQSAGNVTVTLLPEYPFSLDPGVSAVKSLGTISGAQNQDNSSFYVNYKLKVDKDAVDGDNEIKLKFSEDDGSSYNLDSFNISVLNPRTDFDVVVQDSSTLAIANVGSNVASAVIVRIPNQQNFRVNGSSAVILGNLNAGDYTLATFQISSVRGSNSTNGGNLTVEISYTDTLGIRRTIEKDVPYGFSFSGVGNITGRFAQGNQTLLPSSGLLYIIVGVVGIVIIATVIKIRSRKKK
jgi:hypothetical protein